MLKVKAGTMFKRDYKRAKKRREELILYLMRTGTHSNLFPLKTVFAE